MKFITFLSLLCLLYRLANAQMGSLNLEQPANSDNQIDYRIYINSSNVARKIFQIKQLDTFFIENKTAPGFPNNVRYTENEKESEYIIILPIFPVYITKDDVQVTVYQRTINIKVKDSGIQTNELFLPMFDKDTLSSMYKGRDYELDVEMFQQVSNTSMAAVTIAERNLKRGNSFEIRVKIPSEFIFIPKYFKHFDWTYVKNLPVINGSEHNGTYDWKVDAGFKRTVESSDSGGLSVEVFRKSNDGAATPQIDVNAFDIKQYLQQSAQNGRLNQVKKPPEQKVLQEEEAKQEETKKDESESAVKNFGDVFG